MVTFDTNRAVSGGPGVPQRPKLGRVKRALLRFMEAGAVSEGSVVSLSLSVWLLACPLLVFVLYETNEHAQLVWLSG